MLLTLKELMSDPPVQEMPVQSLITNPSPNDIISAVKSGCESISVKGIAWGGGGRGAPGDRPPFRAFDDFNVHPRGYHDKDDLLD